MKTQTFIAIKILLVMNILTGILYPLLITGIAQVIFPYKANGSMIKMNNVIVGSELIGQKNDSVAYFWPRPSAIDYNPIPSGASNYGPTSKNLQKLVTDRRKAFATKNSVDSMSVPPEMLLSSASGLDPDISPTAAMLQLDRIARVRNFSPAQKEQLTALIQNTSEHLQFSILGEERINVFMLNLALDKLNKQFKN
jgi:potassium-transporting ATPase KdpC subunit